MNTVKVKNVVLGEGIPKICVPIVAVTKEAIIEEAKSFKNLHIDVVEWRIDWFEGGDDSTKVIDVLKDLTHALGDVPLLVTFRTSNEGGEKFIDPADYLVLCSDIAKSGYADLIDVEVFIGDEIARDIIEVAHANDVKVVASNHDFDKTPDKEELINRMRRMQDLGADIPKIAVMPTCAEEVLTLLDATVTMKNKYANGPIITMSMAGKGVISRLSGEVFGSCLTFGAAKKASAPGQIGVEELYGALQLIHKSFNGGSHEKH